MPLAIFYSQIIWQNDAKIGAVSSEILTARLPDHLILSSFGKTASNSPRFAVACMQLGSVSPMPENRNNAAIAPAVERTLGKGEVACSNHAGSTISLASVPSWCIILELPFMLRG